MNTSASLIAKINKWMNVENTICKEFINIYDTNIRQKAANIFTNRITTGVVGPYHICKRITLNCKHDDIINKTRIENFVIGILADIIYGTKKTNSDNQHKFDGLITNPQLDTMHSILTTIPVGTNRVLVEFRYSLTEKNKTNGTCYLIGAISDNPNAEEQFAAKEKELVELGYSVYNPFRENQQVIEEYGLRTKNKGQEKHVRRIVKKNIVNLTKCKYYAFANDIASDGAKIDKQLCEYLKLIEIK